MAKTDAPSFGETRPASRSRLMSIVATVGLLLVVASCCLCGGTVYRQWPRFEQDRQAAIAATRDILPITVPAVFTPEGTIDWNIWMLLRMKGAYYSLNTGDGELSLLEVDSRFIDNAEFRAHVIRSLREHGAGGGFDLTVTSVETRSYDVQGQPAEFHFLAGEDRTTGNARRLVDGIVDGPRGPVMISLWVHEDNWDPQMIDDMMASIGRTADVAD